MPAGWFPLVLVVAESRVVLVQLERSVELGVSQGQTQGDENTALGKSHLPISTPAPLGFEEIPKGDKSSSPLLSPLMSAALTPGTTQQNSTLCAGAVGVVDSVEATTVHCEAAGPQAPLKGLPPGSICMSPPPPPPKGNAKLTVMEQSRHRRCGFSVTLRPECAVFMTCRARTNQGRGCRTSRIFPW